MGGGNHLEVKNPLPFKCGHNACGSCWRHSAKVQLLVDNKLPTCHCGCPLDPAEMLDQRNIEAPVSVFCDEGFWHDQKMNGSKGELPVV